MRRTGLRSASRREFFAAAAGALLLPRPVFAQRADKNQHDKKRDAAEGDASTKAAARARLGRAARWLWRQQAADGGWPSATYGLLKTGQALTPSVLDALLDVPADVCPRPEGGVARALAFLRRSANDRGALGLSDPDVWEYPNYATAYALRCLLRAEAAEDRPLIARMRAYLVAEQYTEARGFSPDHAAYGGWGFGGEQPAGVTGHMDLAHTRRVLEALRAAEEHAVSDEQDESNKKAALFRRAETFLRHVQKRPDDPRPQPLPIGVVDAGKGPVPSDGGFYFSPVVDDANKAGYGFSRSGAPYYRSYATATCDGLLALRAAGVAPDDPRCKEARAWLAAHPRLDVVEGIPADSDFPWGPALFFYHQAVRADVYDQIGWPDGARREMFRLLAAAQGDDVDDGAGGSFANRDSPLQKENDPLVATSMAVRALARILRRRGVE